MRYVVDSNVWIAYYLVADKHHVKAKSFFDSAHAGINEVILPTAIIGEVVCNLAARQPDNVLIPKLPHETQEEYHQRWSMEMDSRIDFLLLCDAVKILSQPKDLWLKVPLVGSRLRLRVMDAVVVVMAFEQKCDVLTFDMDFKRVHERSDLIRPNEWGNPNGLTSRAGPNFLFEYEKRKPKVYSVDDVLGDDLPTS
jgi:predicted nucleic acid-binding protein